MRVLGVFAKYWQPGRVKTRLAPVWGESRAAQIHRAFLRCTLRRTLGCAKKHALVFTPEQRRADFADLAGDDWELVPQRQGDLGARLKEFFRSEQSCQSGAVVVIGSDSPNLPIELLEDAYEALDRVPVVLGPSTDGGYYLVGLRGAIPPIFENVDWGTPRLWQQTVRLLEAEGIAMQELAPWYDVDQAEDLLRLRGELGNGGDRSPPVADLASELDRICSQ